MSYYRFANQFVWFVARVTDIEDPEKLGRVKIRLIHNQTGELGKKKDSYGIVDEDLLWAYPLSAIQSASLHYKKISDKSHPLEGFDVPPWIGAVGLSPTGIAVGTYVYGFYLDGHEQNIPLIFGTYHKKSVDPEPPSQDSSNRMLQLRPPEDPKYYSDVAPLARGEDDAGNSGQTLPKAPYFTNKLWTNTTSYRNIGTVDEFPTGYNTKYPYNTTYTTKSGHAIELDDTPGFERTHFWHKSGSYEEISSGHVINKDDNKDYPYAGGNKYTYVTASGVPEARYDGRRSRKTTDSFFDVVVKDKNELTGRDHNVEIANTETVKIGNTLNWTIGHQKPPANRINKIGVDYDQGGIGKWNSLFDVANNSIATVANNNIIQIGLTPEQERRLTQEDINNLYVDVANNHTTTIANNSYTVIGNNHVVQISNNSVTTIGNQAIVIIDENCHVRVKGITKIVADSDITINCKANIMIEDGDVTIKKNLKCIEYATGTIVGMNGRTAHIKDGLVVDIT